MISALTLGVCHEENRHRLSGSCLGDSEFRNDLKPGPARLAVSFTKEAHMIKGFVIAALALLGASQLDRYYCAGHYTDGALSMLRQIRHSFRI
jgi:hypothetical protein